MNQDTDFAFLYFSEILGKKVRDPSGDVIGRIDDIVASSGEIYPVAKGLLLRLKGGEKRLAPMPVNEIRTEGPKTDLVVDRDQLSDPDLSSSDFNMKDLLYDKQIVDVQGAKVERVNDVHLLCADQVRIVHVDVGFTGLLRRLGIEGLIRGVWKITGRPLKDELISWKFVQPLVESSEPGQPIRLQVEQARIRDLHPGELADILEDLGKEERAAILEKLEPEEVADVLEEADDDTQAAVISQIEPEEAADILEEMDPGEAADILGNLPDAHSEGIIAEVEEEDRALIEPLTEYEERTAAGLMTPEFVSIPPDATVEQALDAVREMAPEIEAIYYVYILDAERKLQGVTTLRSLFRAKPDDLVAEIMEKRLITLPMEGELEEIADMFQKYSLLGCPVVDEESRMMGVILLKHAFDELLPEFRREGHA